MIKATMLVPTHYNDGSHVGDGYHVNVGLWFINKFGGVTIQHGLRGKYRMADGTIADDELVAYTVVCEQPGLYDLSKLAASIACGLQQESVYLDYHDCNVEFIKPGTQELI
jgi:hypothetical protein